MSESKFTVLKSLQAVALIGLAACSPGRSSDGTVRFDTQSLPDGEMRAAYNATLELSGGTAPYTVAVISGQLPPGLDLNGNVISGSPSSSGSFQFVLGAQDSETPPGTGSQQFELFVDPLPGGSLGFLNDRMPSVLQNQNYSERIRVAGGAGAPYQFAVTAGDLPTGMTLGSTTGDLSGRPSTAGIHLFTVTVTDSNSTSRTRNFSLSVISQDGVKPIISLVPSRTSGAAPLSVFFDATGTTSLDYPKAFHHVDYHWDFGDPESDSPTSSGAVAAHVFDKPGTYTVKLTTMEPDGSTEAKDTLITVDDPDVVFGGTSTVCFSNSSDFTGAPSGAQQVTTSRFDVAMSYYDTDKRLLFKRGDTFAHQAAISVTKPGVVGAFGQGINQDTRGIYDNNPKIISSDGTTFRVQGSGITLMDLDITDSSPNGAGHAVIPLRRVEQMLMYRLRTRGFDVSINVSMSIVEYYQEPAHDEFTLANCHVIAPGKNCMFLGGTRVAIIGNKLESPTREHVVRVSRADKAVIGRNEILDPNVHAIKLHSAHSKALYGDFTQRIVIRNNLIRADVAWPVAVGPQDQGKDEWLRDILIEHNTLFSQAQVQIGMFINSANTTLRNNIFISEGGAWSTFMCINITRRGIEPVPSGVEAYHNTFYNPLSGHGRDYLVHADAHQGAVIAKNNLIYAPLSQSSFATGGPVTITTGGNMQGTDPKFVDPGNYDLRLQSSSAALAAGTPAPVCDDYLGKRRTTTAPDIGAHHR